MNDFDLDGRENRFEWLTRTDPKNKNDYWRGSIHGDGSGGIELLFDSILNRTTWVEERTNLADWVLLDDPANLGFPASIGTTEVISLPAPLSPHRYFRFNIEE